MRTEGREKFGCRAELRRHKNLVLETEMELFLSARAVQVKLYPFLVGRDRWARGVGYGAPSVPPYPKTISAKSILDEATTALIN
jgi:hypothetical protein